MDQDHGELTLADILADPVTLALMDADGVDPVVLEATLSQKAGDLMRSADPVNRRRRVTDGEVDKAVIAECEADVSVESRKSGAMARNPRAVRNTLRLASAVVLLAFVLCHLTAHSFLLVSFERAGAALDILMYPWRSVIGTAVLVSALLAHYSNALWSITCGAICGFRAGNGGSSALASASRCC